MRLHPEAQPSGQPGEGPGPMRRGTLRSLRNRNFRLYLVGQGLSQTGTWFQQTAEIWVILQITGSGTAVGMHSVLRFGPLLLLGIPAGLLTDRHNRWRLLITTQTAYAVAAAILALASFHSYPSLYLIYGMVLVQGIINAIDNPLRRSFVRDLVTDEELTNAVSLNSTVATVARFVGPAIGGVLIALVGVPWCFAINAISYGAVLLSLFLLDQRSFRATVLVSRARGQLREGFRYAMHNRRIGRTLIMVALLGTFVWNWNVILPLYATDTFHGGATLYGWLLSLLSLGSFVGALLAARLVRVSGAFFRLTGALLAVGLVAAALAPCLPLAIVGLVVLGAASTSFMVGAQAHLQLESDDAMSGRILALFSVGFVGTRPIGGIVTGWVMDLSGPRLAFGMGAVVTASMVLALLLRRTPWPRRTEGTGIESHKPETPSPRPGPPLDV
jgi:MFS family permease